VVQISGVTMECREGQHRFCGGCAKGVNFQLESRGVLHYDGSTTLHGCKEVVHHFSARSAKPVKINDVKKWFTTSPSALQSQ
jgi:hypothetical protein